MAHASSKLCVCRLSSLCTYIHASCNPRKQDARGITQTKSTELDMRERRDTVPYILKAGSARTRACAARPQHGRFPDIRTATLPPSEDPAALYGIQPSTGPNPLARASRPAHSPGMCPVAFHSLRQSMQLRSRLPVSSSTVASLPSSSRSPAAKSWPSMLVCASMPASSSLESDEGSCRLTCQRRDFNARPSLGCSLH